MVLLTPNPAGNEELNPRITRTLGEKTLQKNGRLHHSSHISSINEMAGAGDVTEQGPD